MELIHLLVDLKIQFTTLFSGSKNPAMTKILFSLFGLLGSQINASLLLFIKRNICKQKYSENKTEKNKKYSRILSFSSKREVRLVVTMFFKKKIKQISNKWRIRFHTYLYIYVCMVYCSYNWLDIPSRKQKLLVLRHSHIQQSEDKYNCIPQLTLKGSWQ